jgi:hypothetical protein
MFALLREATGRKFKISGWDPCGFVVDKARFLGDDRLSAVLPRGRHKRESMTSPAITAGAAVYPLFSPCLPKFSRSLVKSTGSVASFPMRQFAFAQYRSFSTLLHLLYFKAEVYTLFARKYTC